jgi:phosphate transport system permease protein
VSVAPQPLFVPRLERRRRVGRIFATCCALLALCTMGVLGVLLFRMCAMGFRRLSWTFLTHPPARLNIESCGVWPAIVGSLWVIVLTALIAIPVGIGAAIYLEEYARKTKFTQFIQTNIANLAGVPSIVYGLLGLVVFADWLSCGRSVLAGALTLSLLILPVIIIASQEALKAVPDSIRQAAFGIGATRWQTVRAHVLPAAIPGIMTGVILALSRAIGETAPLITLGALTFVSFTPGGSWADYDPTLMGKVQWAREALFDAFTVMPIQIYNWAADPLEEFHELAASGIIVLLGALLTMNAVAVTIRAWHERNRI